jgi:hypothetical protein
MFNSLRQSLARTIWPEVFEQARQSEEKDARIAELISELRETEELCRELDDERAKVVERIYRAVDALNGTTIDTDPQHSQLATLSGESFVVTCDYSVRTT